MKILVFFRSKEFSNAIVASAKSRLETEVPYMDIDFINLDKRNYIKVLSQMEEIPQFIYIWYDEEKITEYINETYPSIKVIHFDAKNAVDRIPHYDYYGYKYNTKEYRLADIIINNFKANLSKITMYQVDKQFHITKVEMDDIDKSKAMYPVFKTKEEAETYCLDCIQNNVTQLESNILKTQEELKQYKTELKKQNKLLQKFTKTNSNVKESEK